MEQHTDIVIELRPVTNGNDAAAHANGQDCVDGGAARKNEPEEQRLLGNVPAVNGNAVPVDDDVEAQTTPNEQKKSVVRKLKEELSQKICHNKVPLWVVLILIFILVICLIFASLALCTVIYEDPDEKYDPTQFNEGRNFSGSFRLPNLNSTEKLLNLASNHNQPLAKELEKKLDDLYKNSPALGRYFLRSDIYNFSDGPVTAPFRLMFLMPAKDREELTYFTLSREMVYNVFRQFLYDQEVDTSERLYIEPTSLNMSSE